MSRIENWQNRIAAENSAAETIEVPSKERMSPEYTTTVSNAQPTENGRKESFDFSAQVIKAGLNARLTEKNLALNQPRPAQKTTKPTPVEDFTKVTPQYQKLPSEIVFSAKVYQDMQTLTNQSIDTSGNSNEHGGTLASDSKGTLTIVNQGAGTSGTFTPKTTVGANETYAGTFHTHPYGKNDGIWDGVVVPFSAGDVATVDDYREKISVVQSGKNVYVLVPTSTTPKTISTVKAEKAYNKVFTTEYAKQIKAGKTEVDAAGIAGEKATLALAKRYKLGYYRGENGQPLHRINP